MEIILGKTAGFCYGVQNAVEGAKTAVQNRKKVYCLGEIVHNKTVIEQLKKQGLEFINNIEEAKDTTIIRAHGEPEQTYINLKEKNIEILDYTCPNVIKTHKIAVEGRKQGKFIILIGIKEHPEAKATLSYAGENSYLLQEKDEYFEMLEVITKSGINEILILAQTTYNSNKFDDIVSDLKNLLKDKNLKIEKTICGATEIRQKETAEIAQKVDTMFIIGDKKSSNTNKLYDISKNYCKNVIFIQNVKELNLEEVDMNKKIGIMAGASTPKDDIDEVIKAIKEGGKN